jgi:hypothetical protein
MSKHWMASFWGLLVLALIFGGVAQAQTTAPKKAPAKKAAVHEVAGNGTITSADATHLVISHTVNGKAESMTLMLTPETKKEGTLEAGSKVAYRYHMENNDMVATSVRATATAAKAKTGKTKAKKS